MVYPYKPLQGEEIRLLSIKQPEDGETAGDSPIRCSLIHVNLSSPSPWHPNQRFKGDNHVWPELHVPSRDTGFLTRKTAAATASSSLSDGPELSAHDWLGADRQLPWRHAWGDYLALSYVWGSPTPQRSILLDGVEFSVTPNLFAALLYLRQSRRILQGFQVWIDAICINQADTAERGQQVARMRDIYASAWQVLVWLGDAADDSDLAIATLRWLAARQRSPAPVEGLYPTGIRIDASPLFVIYSTYTGMLRKQAYRALFYFLTRPYWGRMWIVQEIAMAREDSPVVCGNSCLSWIDIFDAARFIANDEARIGRDIIRSVHPRPLQSRSFEFAKDRVEKERPYSAERTWRLLIDLMTLQRSQNNMSLPANPRNMLLPLLIGRDARITDEKDRVYGILGIKAVADRVALTPNYVLSLESIFRDFTTKMLQKGDLEILRLISIGGGRIHSGWSISDVPPMLNHPLVTGIFKAVSRASKTARKSDIGLSCNHHLPSWTVCLSCSQAPVAQLWGLYRAGGGASSPPTPAPDSGLTVSAIVLDKICALGSFHPAEVDSTYPLNKYGTAQNRNAYSTIEGAREALWRTLTGDTTAEGGCRAPESFSWLLEPKLWTEGIAGLYTNQFGLHEHMSRNGQLKLCGYTLEQLVFGFRSFFRRHMRDPARVYNATEEQLEAVSWAMNATAWRRLFGTENGRIGLAPAAARADDVVAVLLGCSVPMVLRRSGGRWKLVGECYMHGIMYGEILDENTSPDQILLC